jgi:major membrane immunogen (membrane-anchored lipoprotein)
MKKIIVMIMAALLTACSAGSQVGIGTKDSSKSYAAKRELAVKYAGKEQRVATVSAWAYHSTFTNTAAGGEISTSSSTSVVLANFELDTSQAFISINKRKIEKPEEVKVVFSFLGEKGTKEDTPIKAGDYPAEGEIFGRIRGISIFHFTDGKEKQTEFDEKAMKGKLTIKSVQGTTVNGEIDVTDGTNSVKGSFSANGHKSVK